MKINKQALVKHNTPIHQPTADRQAPLNKGSYKLKKWQRTVQQPQQSAVQPEVNRLQSAEARQALPNKASYKPEDWQKIMQQQQQSAAPPETNRAYRSGPSFSEYAISGKMLFATALLSSLTTGKSEATAPSVIPSGCNKAEIFELFNIDGWQRQEPTYFRLFPEAGSMAAVVDEYIASKTPQPNNPIVEQLLTASYLTYPTHLNIKYRVVNHSPGQRHSDPQPCPTHTAITPEKQRNLAQHTYHAVQQAADDLSAHTQFNLHEANAHEAAEIKLDINTCNNGGIAQGAAEQSIQLWAEVLQDDELTTATDTQDTSLERVVNITQAYRMHCNQAAIMLLPSHRQIDDANSLKALATHEFAHALGLVDTYFYPQIAPYHPSNYLTREQTIMSYINTVPASKHFHETFISSDPQSLMPYDIPALDMIADFIRQEQAEQEGTPVMPNPLPIKSPHRGDTRYRFTPGGNTIEVIDQRNDHTSYAYVMHPTPAGEVKRTLIDPKGYDTWDFRQYHTDLKIDVRPNGATIFNYSALTSSSMESKIKNGPINAIITQVATAQGNIYLPASDDPNYLPERVLGGDGNDEIRGNALDNAFHPGNGHDVITGGKGKDDYVFQHGGDNTLTITDFDIKHDRLVLHPASGVRNFYQLKRHLHKKNNGDLEIHLSGENRIILNKMARKNLGPKNFLAHRNYYKLK